MTGRTIAIGDIHGCRRTLDALLDMVRPRRDDMLVVLGDCIDRGPDSRGVIERLLSLRDGCTLVCIKGNHEELMLQSRDDRRTFRMWQSWGGVQTLDSYAATQWTDIPTAHLAFMAGWMPYLETSTHIFTHAAYDPDLPLAATSSQVLRWQSLQDHMPDRPHRTGKVVIVGHTVQEAGVLSLPFLKCIDTGCCYGGTLTAMEMHTGRLWQVRNQDVPG